MSSVTCHQNHGDTPLCELVHPNGQVEWAARIMQQARHSLTGPHVPSDASSQELAGRVAPEAADVALSGAVEFH